MQALRPALVLALLLFAGCGGADRLQGEADVPEGYATYRGEGVSFAHPDGFESETKANANGTREVTLKPAGADPQAYIHLTVAPERGDDIEPLARSVRVAAEDIFAAEPGDEREVDVEGATAARRLDIVQPERDGEPRVERRDLLVLARDGRFYILDVGAVAGAEDVDRDAVIESFRLDGGA